MVMSEQYKDVCAGVCAIQKFSKPKRFEEKYDRCIFILMEVFLKMNILISHLDWWYWPDYNGFTYLALWYIIRGKDSMVK